MAMPRGRQLRPAAERQGNAAKQRGHGGHHDGTEAQKAGLVDGFFRRLALLTLGFQGKVDHHDRVLLHNTDQQDDADQRDDAEVCTGQLQSEQRAHAGRWQRGQDGDGVDVAFVQHAQDDVHGDQRGQDE